MSAMRKQPAGLVTPSIPRGQWGVATDRYRRNRLAVIGIIFVIILVVVALCATWIAPYAYDQTDYDRLLAPAWSPGHLLGTDQLGRDVLSRLLVGLRTALMVAIVAEGTALLVALAVGLTAGYRGGRADTALMGFTDVMYAFPTYLFAVILVTVAGRSLVALAFAIGVASWVTQARLVRAQALKYRNFEFVEAARAMGAGGFTIAVRYILPNALGPILVTTSFAIPGAIVTESGLALLGLGVQPPTPSWGSMLADGASYIGSAPHLVMGPLILFAITVLAFTWVGDGLRDAFDVRNDR